MAHIVNVAFECKQVAVNNDTLILTDSLQFCLKPISLHLRLLQLPLLVPHPLTFLTISQIAIVGVARWVSPAIGAVLFSSCDLPWLGGWTDTQYTGGIN